MSVLKYKDPTTGTWVQIGGSSGSSYTDEQVRQVVATFLKEGSNITLAHNDSANTLTISSSGGGGGGGGSGNIDGGSADSSYGGTVPMDGGNA